MCRLRGCQQNKMTLFRPPPLATAGLEHPPTLVILPLLPLCIVSGTACVCISLSSCSAGCILVEVLWTRFFPLQCAFVLHCTGHTFSRQHSTSTKCFQASGLGWFPWGLVHFKTSSRSGTGCSRLDQITLAIDRNRGENSLDPREKRKRNVISLL